MISLATVMSKPSSLGTPVGPSAKSVYYEPQLTVVHIQRSFPCDLLYIYSQLVAPAVYDCPRHAAIRLLAAPMACMSPVKCRLISSIGMI